MDNTIRMPRFFPFLALAGAAFMMETALTSSVRADIAADLEKFSAFKSPDLGRLASGEILGERGEAMAHPRGIATEVLFFLPIPIEKAVDAIRLWNPAQTGGLDVYVHRRLTIPPKPDEFGALRSLSDNAAIAALRKATAQASPGSTDLFLSRNEALKLQQLRQQGGDAFAAFWASTLFHRASLFLSEGIAATPPYDIRGEALSPAKEFEQLFASNKLIRGQFGQLIAYSRLAGRFAHDKTPSMAEFAKSKGIQVSPYWEAFSVQGTGTLNLGCTFARQGGADGGWQVLDAQYYVSGGYIVSAVLYQCWPATLNGQSGTVVWRGDLLSSPGFTYTKGVERMATAMVMLQEVKKSIEILRRHVSS